MDELVRQILQHVAVEVRVDHIPELCIAEVLIDVLVQHQGHFLVVLLSPFFLNDLYIGKHFMADKCLETLLKREKRFPTHRCTSLSFVILIVFSWFRSVGSSWLLSASFAVAFFFNCLFFGRGLSLNLVRQADSALNL